MRQRILLTSAALCLSLVIAGCSGETVKLPDLSPVSGTVTLAGKPADGVTVRFVPRAGTSGNGGFGTTQADGSFTLQHLSGEAGVEAGEYDVVFSKFEMPDGSAVAPDIQPESVGARQVIPTRYTDATTSNTVATVAPSGGTFDFDLK